MHADARAFHNGVPNAPRPSAQCSGNSSQSCLNPISSSDRTQACCPLVGSQKCRQPCLRVAWRDKSPPGYWKQFARHGQDFIGHPGLSSPRSCARQTESWRDRIMQRESPGGSPQEFCRFRLRLCRAVLFVVGELLFIGSRTRERGWLPAFPRFPPLSGCRAELLWSLPGPNGQNLAHPKVSAGWTLAWWAGLFSRLWFWFGRFFAQ